MVFSEIIFKMFALLAGYKLPLQCVCIPIQVCTFPYRRVHSQVWIVQHALEGTEDGCPELWLCRDVRRVKLLFLSRVLKGFPAAVGYTQSPLHPLVVQMQCVKRRTGS